MTKYPCRIRQLRKSAHLSQRELAYLVGLKSQGVLSQIEAGRKRPGLAIAAACAIVFDRPIAEIFPSLHVQFERLALASAREFAQSEEVGPATQAFLTALLARLEVIHARL